LKKLPVLPNSLIVLKADNNLLEELPELPAMQTLEIQNNKLTKINMLPIPYIDPVKCIVGNFI
jgi:hypothetical protein